LSQHNKIKIVLTNVFLSQQNMIKKVLTNVES